MSSSCLISRGCCRSLSFVLLACILLAHALRVPSFASDDDEPKQRGIVEAILELIPDWTPTKAAEELAKAIEEHWQQTAPPGESIYSVSFNFDRGSWADFWSKPDIFLVVECEGRSKLLIPDIEYNWDYSPKVYTFRCPTFPPESRCVLRLYDDDSASDAVWKNILTTATSANWKVTGDIGSRAKTLEIPYQGTAFIEVHAEASGEFRLLTAAQADAMLLDAPDQVATAEFFMPKEPSLAPWLMEGAFRKSSKDMGKVRLTHWYTNPIPGPVPPVLLRLAVWAALLLLLGVVVWFFCRASRTSAGEASFPPPELLNDCPSKTTPPGS